MLSGGSYSLHEERAKAWMGLGVGIEKFVPLKCDRSANKKDEKACDIIAAVNKWVAIIQADPLTIDNIDIEVTLQKVEKLLSEEKGLSPATRSMVELLVLLITLLVGRLNRNSRNSSKPPSSDPNRKRESKAKGERKAGGQKGREGVTLERVENPDKVEVIKVDRRKLPRGKYKVVGYEARQVFDMKISREVTEYRAEIVEDAKGNRFVAPFPEGVTKAAQYGADLKAHAVYMSQYQLIPYKRIQEYFEEQMGIPVSEGSLYNFNQEAYENLEPVDGKSKGRTGQVRCVACGRNEY